MPKSLKSFTKKNPQIATIRIFIFAIAVAIIVNMLSGGEIIQIWFIFSVSLSCLRHNRVLKKINGL